MEIQKKHLMRTVCLFTVGFLFCWFSPASAQCPPSHPIDCGDWCCLNIEIPCNIQILEDLCIPPNSETTTSTSTISISTTTSSSNTTSIVTTTSIDPSSSSSTSSTTLTTTSIQTSSSSSSSTTPPNSSTTSPSTAPSTTTSCRVYETDCGDGTCCSAGSTCCGDDTCCDDIFAICCGGICCPKLSSNLRLNRCKNGICEEIPEDNCCSSTFIFGEDSEEVKLLRNYRDKVLSKTLEGQMIIKLYYKWSPLVVKLLEEDALLTGYVSSMAHLWIPPLVKAMEQDEDFRAKVMEMISVILPLSEYQAE